MEDRVPVTVSAATAALLLAFIGACNASPAPNTWHETAALPMTWIQDMSFVSARVGFAAGGNGQVLRTKDSGVTWTPVLDTPYANYYRYGVHALTPNDVVATGIVNISNAYTAMIRWSQRETLLPWQTGPEYTFHKSVLCSLFCPALSCSASTIQGKPNA